MTLEERRIWPPRPVSVYLDEAWHPAQLLAWRRFAAVSQFLVQLLTWRRGKAEVPPPTWVDAADVRPRQRARGDRGRTA